MVKVGRVGKGSGMCVRVDRKTVLGNPYPMRNESQRDRVCEQFATHFDAKVKQEGAFREEVIRIYRLAKEQDVTLQCWCAPKRCHADHIAQFINSYL